MQTEIKIPHVGESIASVQIQEWLKKEGDSVHKNDPIAVIDSEKTTFDLNAPEDGTLIRILHPAGETVGVGTVVAQFETGKTENTKSRAELNPQPPAEPESASATPSTKSKKTKAKDPALDAKPPPSESSSPASVPAPAPTQISGNAVPKPSRVAAGKQAQDKPKTHPAEANGEPPEGSLNPGDREEELVPMSLLRRTIARRLVEAQQTAAMLTTFNEVDMNAIRSLREQHQEAFVERYGIKLGLMSFFAKAAIDALKRFPVLNAQIRGDDILYRNYFDLGVAIATERGLVVPVIRSAERLSFAETENAIADFARRAGTGELKPDELADGTFTITNGGVFGSLFSTPILNPPQSGILGMHAIEDRVVVRDGTMVIRPMMYLALTYDHRAVDGREAVLFLRRIKELIETPARMLLEV